MSQKNTRAAVLGWSTAQRSIDERQTCASHFIVDRGDGRAVAACGARRFAGQVESAPFHASACRTCLQIEERRVREAGRVG